LRLAVATLNQKRSNGTGPTFVKLGGRVFYKQADLDAWIDQNSVADTTAARALQSAARAA
jgi:predicted DNA-binding transcriptional regulator AlpA